MEFRENSNVTAGRYFETNDIPMTVNKTSPFDRHNTRQYRVRINEENIIQYNNDGTIDIVASNSTVFNAPNELVDEIIRNCAANRNEVINEAYEHDQRNTFLDDVPQSLQTIPPRVNTQSNTQFIPSCSKDVPNNVNFDARVTFTTESTINFKQTYFPTDEPTVDIKKSAEKTTYCRPILNLYSQQFVHKTMQRNARLQRLVQKLVLARQREKQETWNNYINELKNKHRYDNPQSRRISTNYPQEQFRPELIDDYYNKQFICGKSKPCHNLLQDLYGAPAGTQSIPDNNNHANNYNDMPHNMRQLYESDLHCYPTASQGRLRMLQKERDRHRNDFAYEFKPRPHARFYRNNTIIVDSDGKRSRSKSGKRDTSPEIPELEPESQEIVTQNESLQTENKACCIRDTCRGIGPDTDVGVSTENLEDESAEDPSAKEELEKISENISKLKMKIQQNEDKKKTKSLSGIEGKLDALIKSINTFVTDMKAKTRLTSKSTSVCECPENVNMCCDASEHSEEQQVFYSMVRNSTKSDFAFSDYRHRNRDESFTTIDQILHEEMDKSNTIKRDIESLLKIRNNKPCSVHISFDIPTRERSTEVTNSLSKTKVEIETNSTIEEISPPVAVVDGGSENHMTIAVNTDPLGLLALLRVSTETMKQVLSYMPQIDCYSYLSMLQFPQLSPNCVSHYICNICGAAFRRPSQLSDHIQEHNIGNTRDCCVCRHALDLRHKHNGLYSCQYCGQRFTRAYCCELHQQSCAKRFGKRHDVASSLMLLK